MAGLTTAVLVVALAGFFGVLGQWQAALANERKADEKAVQAEEKEREAKQQRDEAQKQRDEVRALNNQLRRTLYASNMNLAKSAWEMGYVQDKFPAVKFLKTRERHDVNAEKA